MHGDEAVHAYKLRQLVETGVYRYDPQEYHGPTLYYCSLPAVAWAGGFEDFGQVGEVTLRVVPALFGIATVALIALLRPALGATATVLAMLALASSPMLSFYSRYYIQETLLAFFVLATIVCAWRYARGGRLVWAGLGGAALGLAHATKETVVLAWAAMAVAAVMTLWRCGLSWRLLRGGVVGLIVAAAVSSAFYSSFGRNPRGVIDAWRAWRVYLERSGDATHRHPWWYYQSFYWGVQSGAVALWSEGVWFVLGVVGALWAVWESGATGCGRGVVGESDGATERRSDEGERVQGPKSEARRAELRGPVRSGREPNAGKAVVCATAVSAVALPGMPAPRLKSRGTRGKSEERSKKSEVGGRGRGPELGSDEATKRRSDGATQGAGRSDERQGARGGGSVGHGGPTVEGSGLVRFLAVYALVLGAIYAAIPYKTPWCAVQFVGPVMIMGGWCVARLLEARGVRAAVRWVGLAVGMTALVSMPTQAVAVNLRLANDDRNPLRYAHPTRDVVRLGRYVERLAAVHPDGRRMLVQVISRNCWPLPWYLRRLERVGYWEQVPAELPAPVVIVDAALADAVARERPEDVSSYYGLRRDQVMVVFVRRALWERFAASQPAGRVKP